MTSIDGKTVLVTGGHRGLGAAVVDEAIARGAAKIYATSRSAVDDPRPQVESRQLDVTSTHSIDTLAEEATDVEIVFNNAGVLHPQNLLDGRFDLVEKTFDTNVYGPLRIARAFAPILKANGGGAIVNMLSVLTWLAGSGSYGASKAAAWSVTNSLREELREHGIQVIGVHAGFIDTDMVADMAMPKARPEDIARAIFDGLEASAHEVLADDASVVVKAALAGPVEALTLSNVIAGSL